MMTSKKAVNQAIACSPALLIQFLIGIGWGWTAPTLSNLKNGLEPDFVISDGDTSLLGSIGEFGRILGPFFAMLFLDRIGRKTTMTLVSIMYVLCWAVTIVARDVNIILATRVVFGIGNGISDVTSSIYITEVCSPRYRGFGGTGILFTFFGGVISANFLSTYLSFQNAATTYTALSVCAISSQYFGVEPPYFLMMRGEYERAKKNLAWLRGTPDIEDELTKIEKNVQEEKQKTESLRTLFTNATNLRAIIVTISFYFLFSFVGFHTVTPFMSLILVPSEMFTSNEYTILFGASQFAATILSLLVVERVGRRPLIIYTFLVIAACNVATSTLMYLHGANHDIAFYPWLLFLSMAVYGIAGSLVSPVIYVILGELLPLSVRAKGGCLAVSASSAGSFLSAVLFWTITTHFGMGTNFVLYTFVSVVIVIFALVVVPETRGKSLHEMHEKPTLEINVQA